MFSIASPTVKSGFAKFDIIISIEGNKLEAYSDDDSKTKTYKLKNAVPVVYNGASTGKAFNMDMIEGKTGSVKLLDNNGNGAYDVVFADIYENYVVSYVDTENMIIYDKFDTSKTLCLDNTQDEPYVAVYDVHGKEISIVSAKENNIVSVYESDDDSYQKYIKAYVSNSTASGEVLAGRSGYYDSYHSIHDSGFTRKTGAHNSVTVATNKGQVDDDFTAKGQLTVFKEAEDATFLSKGAAIYSTRQFLSGGAGVQLLNTPGQRAEYNITIPEDGVYDLVVKAVAWEGDTKRIFSVGDTDYLVNIAPTASWGTTPEQWVATKAPIGAELKAANYTITIEPHSLSWNYDWLGLIKR